MKTRNVLGQKDQVVRDYRAKKYNAVADGMTDLQILDGSAAFTGPTEISVDGRPFAADRFLIATGSHPIAPPIPGLDTVPYLTSDLLDADEAGRLSDLPESLVVLGGGYIAAELAQMFARLGSRVTMVVRSELLGGYEPELGRMLAEAFHTEGIEILANTRIERVSSDGGQVAVAVVTPQSGRIVLGQRLLVATGRRPNLDDLALDRAGVQVDRDGYVVVNPELRTNQSHIWAAGDVIGGQHLSQMATPVGARQGRIVAENAFKDARRTFDGSVIPRAIFTDPQIAVLGLSEAEVKAKHLPAVTATTPLRYVPRAGAIHRPDGFVKMIASTVDERILGVHMIGESAAEVIHEAAMAMHFKAKIDDFIDLIHVYPTMSEALKIGAQAFRKDVTKLSCCAE